MSVWLPGVPRDESIFAPGGGSYSGGPFRGVLHTTEGGWDSSMGVFRSRQTAPHVMAAPPSDPDGPRLVEFIPLDRSAYALQNPSGGVETNRRSALQVEIVWFANAAQQLTAEDLAWLGSMVVGPMTEHAPGPIRFEAPTFFGEDAGFTLAKSTAPQRMAPGAWEAFNGWCGHQHVPENDHWDPGAIDIDSILSAAQEDLSIMDKETRKYFDDKFERIQTRDRLIRETQINQGGRLRDIRASQGATAAELKGIDIDLARIQSSLDDD